MAIKSTVFKVQLSVSDVARNHYEDYALTVARHPSENDLRMIARLVVFALNAHERLQLAKGLASAEEPDLWQLGLTGDVEHWIDLGQPTEKRIRQSCSKADRVSIYTYQPSAAKLWYPSVRDTIERFEHLAVWNLSGLEQGAIEGIVDRSMRLNCLVQDDHVMVTDDVHTLTVGYAEAR